MATETVTITQPQPQDAAPSSVLEQQSQPGTGPLAAKPAGPKRLFNDLGAEFGDFRDDLLRDGFCVVRGAVPRERADEYGQDMFDYLETFKGGLGFRRDDPSTWVEKNLPVINDKGLCLGYGVPHESWAW